MILMNSLRSVSFSVAVSRLENPTMAFKGVRISWLILARNADFSRSDSWAFSRARISASSCLLRSVISKREPTSDIGQPFLSRWSITALVSIQSVIFRPSTSVIIRYSSLICCNLPEMRFSCTWCIRSKSSGCIFRKYSDALIISTWTVEFFSFVKFMWSNIFCASQ